MKICAAASKYISCSLRNVWLFLAVSQCFLKNVRLLLRGYQRTTASERKCAADILCVCVAASTNISMFFNERAAASKKILTTASEIY